MVHNRVIAWLNETGFPLEMKAAKAFRLTGLEVQQSSTYLDPQTQKGREIDILAEDPDIWGFINLSAVAECKSSAQPWVVLTSEDALPAYNRIRTLGVLSEKVEKALQRGTADQLRVSEFLYKETRCGYGLRQAFSKGVDPAYAAAVNVMSACHGVIERRWYGNFPNFSVCVPIVVVDSPLYECELKPNGDLELTEVQSSQFLFSAYLPKAHVTSLIRIINSCHLETTASWVKSLFDALRQDLEPEQEKFFEAASKAAQKHDD